MKVYFVYVTFKNIKDATALKWYSLPITVKSTGFDTTHCAIVDVATLTITIDENCVVSNTISAVP